MSEHEKYCHHLLMLYYPWRNEAELLGPDGTYASKLNFLAVADRVSENRSKFEVDSDEIDEAFEYVRSNPTCDNFCGNLDAINEQENFDIRETIDSIVMDDVNELGVNNDPNTLLPEPRTSTDSQTTIPMSIIQQPAEIQDDAFRRMVRSLNARQRIAYDILFGWS